MYFSVAKLFFFFLIKFIGQEFEIQFLCFNFLHGSTYRPLPCGGLEFQENLDIHV